ncbi:hypothetical protein ABPG77_000869 [Micractinium sp. CCAP 211/92]
MEGRQEAWALPDWWSRYHAQERNFSSIDDGTLAFLSKNFGGLPVVLLLPVDYTMPSPAIVPGVPCTALPPAPLDEEQAHQMPAHAESQPLQRFEAALGTMTSSEAELAELAAWLGAAPPAVQAGPPAVAPRMLPFGAIGQPLLPAPRQLPRPGPVLSVYCDASTLAAPAATPASMPTQAPAAPASTRLHPLADLTNRQMAEPPACDAKALRQISSKLHVAASKKIQPQVTEDEAKALVQQQLRAVQPSRAPWFREGLQSSANRFRGAPKAAAALPLVQAPTIPGTGALASNAAVPGAGVHRPQA